MQTLGDGENKEFKTSTAYWSSAYFFSVAILYLWGYWSPFNINVLEYVSLSDVVKTAAYPIASVFIFMAIGALMGEAMFPEGFMPQGGGANTKTGVLIRRIAPFLVIMYMVFIVMLFLFGPIEKWRVLPILLAIPTSFALNEAGVLHTLIKSERARSAVLFLLAALPPFAYGHGALRANDIITGMSYSYVISEVQGYAYKPDTQRDVRLRYVGKAGEQYFLYSPEARSVLVLPIAEVKVIELKIGDGKESTAIAPINAPANMPSSNP
jgi:hypothetical protein